MIQFDEHIFQGGWFNHQLDEDASPIKKGDFPAIVISVFGGYIDLETLGIFSS